ncbi:MAG: amino acid permease [Deltaproteobacteria bacterium]|nr:amino acid permease [Deltaproteobacteria bacterium]
MIKSFAFSAGLMLSPEVLIIVGHLAGRMPTVFLLLLGAGALCHTLTSSVYSRVVHSQFGRFSGEAEFIRHALGPRHALVFSLFPRLLMFFCLATSVLATAGYALNEVFVYWFPNLGFSFCLIGLILALNLAGERAVNLGQVLFVSVSILGLLVLVIVGFARLDSFGSAAPLVASPGHEVLDHLFWPLAVFVGFELSLFSWTGRNPGLFPVRAMVSAILGIGSLLALWGLVSLAHVSSERLTESTLPHALAARVIMGQWGRIIMGVAVISSACGAVNVLLASVSRLMSTMAQDGLIPKVLVQIRGFRLVPPLLLGGGVFAMLGAGMAGKPILSDFTLAATWFWLASYGAMHLSFQLKRGFMPGEWRVFRQRIMGLLSFGALLFICFALVAFFFSLNRPDAFKLVEILIAVLAFSVAGSAVLLRLGREGARSF